MFDLEISIATWRHSLKLRKVLLDEDLSELEQHVRDQTHTLMLRGYAEEEAFREAIRIMGNHEAVEDAYRRVYWGKLKRKGLLKTTVLTEALMWKNYATISLRNLLRQPGYAFINITGLALGIACCVLIVLFVRDEMAFDRFHVNADRIIRVTLQVPELDRDLEVTPTIVAPLFKRTFPEVEEATRLYDIGLYRKLTVRRGVEAWQEDRFMYADSTVFDVFTFPLLIGTPETALVRPNTVVLTASSALKYFGDQGSAVGQLLTIGTADFEVTGVMADVPSNSHLQFNMLASFASTNWAGQERWDSANFYTYLLLSDGAEMASLRANVDEQLAIARAELGLPDAFNLGLQRLNDIYLVHLGRQKYVWMFTALALLILGVACINYLNLSTARSARRSREVGMRKVLGAHRGQLMRQFFGESGLFVCLAFLFGLAIASLMLPAFNEISGKTLSLGPLVRPEMLLVIAGLLLAIAFGAGIYPSLLLSGFKPVDVLKGGRHGSAGHDVLRKLLVVFQFAVTVFLLVNMAVVFGQLRFIQTTDVGFDREQVVIIPIADRAAFSSIPALKQELLKNASILSASALNAIPGAQRGGYSLHIEGEIRDENEIPRIAASPVDPDVIETIGLDLIEGTGFSEPQDVLAGPDSARYQYVINESLARIAGWTPETAIGKRMSVSGGTRMGEVVGVIRDYNFLTLRDEMNPLALFVEPDWNVLLIKIAPANTASTLGIIEETWNQVASGSPFSYSFLDAEYAAFYESDRKLGQIFAGATLLAIVIACLGLFGLASYTAEARTKEIGIRKALGASVPGMVTMLNKDVTKLVVIGCVLAIPFAWWISNKWLESFAFRIGLSWWIFAGASVAAILIAWITVSWQSIRAASLDPVKTLRYE